RSATCLGFRLASRDADQRWRSDVGGALDEVADVWSVGRMAERRFMVTAALPYSNNRPHVGHVAGAYLPANTYVRYLRAKGDDVRFVCGSDDNGVAALIAARKEGRSVEELTAYYNGRQRADFAGLGIHFDIYGGTHQPGFTELHEKLSQEFFKAI